MNIETLAQDIKDIATEIVEKESNIYENEKDIADCKVSVEKIKLSLEKNVLFNPDFKNEGQRKNALSELIAEDEDIQWNIKEIETKENHIKEVEFEIKTLKIEKNYKETLLKLEFIKLEKGV